MLGSSVIGSLVSCLSFSKISFLICIRCLNTLVTSFVQICHHICHHTLLCFLLMLCLVALSHLFFYTTIYALVYHKLVQFHPPNISMDILGQFYTSFLKLLRTVLTVCDLSEDSMLISSFLNIPLDRYS